MSAWDFQAIPVSKVQDVDTYKLKTGTEFKINKKIGIIDIKKSLIWMNSASSICLNWQNKI